MFAESHISPRKIEVIAKFSFIHVSEGQLELRGPPFADSCAYYIVQIAANKGRSQL